jgi:GH24 family phage-related lysozyme (muramidase)
MKMSGAARARMRTREKPEYHYYNDMGGNCTWGIGNLAHLGRCSADEMKKSVSPAQAEATFSAKISEAERAVRRNVKSQALTQDQFDALVSLTYNVGATGADDTFKLVDSGDLQGAAENISAMTKVRVKTKHGSKMVLAKGLAIRRAEESAPFRKPSK